MPDGILRSADGFTYEVTPDDAIWLARAAKFEGRRDAAATIWSLAQRFVEIRGPRFPTLKSVVLAYSQPVNPIWRRDGSMCRPGGQYADEDDCAERRLAVRDRAAVDNAVETVPLVQAWLRGELPNPVPRGSEFAAPYVSRNCLDEGRCTSVVLASENWYLTTARTERWPRNFVTISGMGEGSRTGLWVTLGAIAAIIIGASAAYGSRGRGRKRRRRR